MRAPLVARGLLATVGVAVALRADGEQAGLAGLAIAVGFTVVGEGRLLLRLVVTTVPLLFLSAVLWMFVEGVDAEGLTGAGLRLFTPGSPLLPLARALAGSSAVVLAIGTVPDGEGISMMRSLWIPRAAATIIAAGGSAAAGIGESFSRSVTSLRAHGIVGPGRLGMLRRLGPIMALTWTSGLSEVVARAEGKWSGNAFLANLDPARPKASRDMAWGTFVTVAIAAALLAILLG